MKNLIFRIALRVVGSTIIFSPKLCGAVLMFTQMGWETTLTPTPPSFLPDCRMAVVFAMGRVVDPMANPIRFEELVQTISMDVAGGAELTTHFSRKFELVGDPETFARVTLEGFASGNVVATGTVFTAVFNGGVTNVLVGGP